MVFGKDDVGGDGQFNQAAFQQARLNELFSQIDKMSIDLFAKDLITEKWCYELVFNNLNSVLSTISPKLTSDELKLLNKFRGIIRGYIEIKKIFTRDSTMLFSGEENKTIPNLENRNLISDLLFEYRLTIEKYMDAHGLSNPEKEKEGGWD